jgi:hypothetical protein
MCTPTTATPDFDSCTQPTTPGEFAICCNHVDKQCDTSCPCTNPGYACPAGPNGAESFCCTVNGAKVCIVGTSCPSGCTTSEAGTPGNCPQPPNGPALCCSSTVSGSCVPCMCNTQMDCMNFFHGSEDIDCCNHQCFFEGCVCETTSDCPLLGNGPEHKICCDKKCKGNCPCMKDDKPDPCPPDSPCCQHATGSGHDFFCTQLVDADQCFCDANTPCPSFSGVTCSCTHNVCVCGI